MIIEYALTQYIRCFSAVVVSTESIRFTFAQRLEIAYLLGFGNHDPVLLPTVERLNKVRNQVAHTFNLDRGALDEMLRINSEDYDAFTVKNDRERISRLRSICAFICGRVAGERYPPGEGRLPGLMMAGDLKGVRTSAVKDRGGLLDGDHHWG